MTTNRTAQINFHPGNLFSYKEQTLALQNGARIVYGQGGRAWEVRAEVTDGRKWYWGALLFETDTAVNLCYWLNLNAASLPAPLTPENNTEARQQADDEAEQAQDEPMTCTIPAPAEHSQTYLERYKFLRADYQRFPTPQTAELLFVTWNNYRNALICEEHAAETSQPERQSHMFAATNADLPLFSGTAPRGQAQTFNPPAADSHRQAKLF